MTLIIITWLVILIKQIDTEEDEKKVQISIDKKKDKKVRIDTNEDKKKVRVDTKEDKKRVHYSSNYTRIE